MVYLERASFIILILAVFLSDCHVLGAPTISSIDALPRKEPGVLFLPDAAIVVDDGYELSIQGVLGSIVLILVALALWLRGSTLRDSSQPIVGMVMIGFVAWLFLANFEPASTYGNNSQTIYLLVPIACGLVGSCLMICTVSPVTLMLLGGLGGVVAGLWVLGWRDGLTVRSDWGRAVLLVILTILGCTLAALDYFFHIIGAALTGAYVLMLGLDIYFHTGFSYCFLATFDRNPSHVIHYHTSRETHIIHAILIVAVVVGIIVQLCTRLGIVHHHERAFGSFYSGYPKVFQRNMPSYYLRTWLPPFPRPPLPA